MAKLVISNILTTPLILYQSYHIQKIEINSISMVYILKRIETLLYWGIAIPFSCIRSSGVENRTKAYACGRALEINHVSVHYIKNDTLIDI